MAEITTNLTVAWLDAFARVRAPKSLLDTIEDGAYRAGASHTLTDVIESALRAAGEDRPAEPVEATSVIKPEPVQSSQLVDRLA